MSFLSFVKKHKSDVIRGAAALCMIILLALFISAFKNGSLPHSADGDAFDSIYAIGEEQNG